MNESIAQRLEWYQDKNELLPLSQTSSTNTVVELVLQWSLLGLNQRAHFGAGEISSNLFESLQIIKFSTEFCRELPRN